MASSSVWTPVTDLVAECCPDAVTKFVKERKTSLIPNVRNHLCYIGWKIEFLKGSPISRFRYTSPEGNIYYSLRQLCQELGSSPLPIPVLTPPRSSSSPSPLLSTSQSVDEPSLWTSITDLVAVYCPDAITKYMTKRKHALVPKVRNHLCYMGWEIEFIQDRHMRRFRYTSPDGNIYFSLGQLCQELLSSRSLSPPPSPSPLLSPSEPDDEPQVWTSVPDLVAECYPNAVTKYAREGTLSLITAVRSHLCYMGWSIEFMEAKYFSRFRYTSPNGKIYFSLRRLCKEFLISASPLQPPPSPSRSPYQCNGEPSDSTLSSLSEQALEPEMKVRPRAYTSQYLTQLTPLSAVPQFDVATFEPEYCPQAVIDWHSCSLKQKLGRKAQLLSLKVKRHLSAMGWMFWYAHKGRKQELRYQSPNGKCYLSLHTACKSCIEDGSLYESLALLSKPNHVLEGSPCSATTLATMVTSTPNGGTTSRLAGTKRRIDFLPFDGSPFQLEPDNRIVPVSTVVVETLSNPEHEKVKSPEVNTGKVIPDTKKLRGRTRCSNLTQRSGKIVRRERKESGPLKHRPRTVLSFLFENNVVESKTKVQYGERGKKGRLSSDGIHCDCCLKVFTVSGFEAHSGSAKHRPSANIFLEDGRSLLDCQLQALDCNNKSRSSGTLAGTNGNLLQHVNDDICSICHYGGELMLCDLCPSSFHRTCLCLNDLPEGDWFCPSCRCKICQQGGFNRDYIGLVNINDDGKFLNCDQCECNFHFGCLKSEGHPMLEGYCGDPNKNWFCSVMCEKIFQGLHSIIGETIPLSVDNLTMTLLKIAESDKPRNNGSESTDLETTIQNFSKLHLALDVMHECFEPILEPDTRKDLVEKVVFSKRSKLRRLNFGGFYTAVLQNNDELITVANVRVYGEKVAEVPLIGTRFQFRRRGMCRILMNGLEKLLANLGVERIILPAVPGVVQTWTSCFGFTVMTDSERVQFLNFTFLIFQDTILCQKLLSPQTVRMTSC